MSPRTTRIKKNRLSTAVFAAMLVSSVPGFAQDQATDSTPARQATNLDKVVVTGSLIPQSQIETVTPVTTITAEDIHTRGFTSVADVLRSTSFASGAVQGGETAGSFTQGADAVSMFGLDPGYTKYLINGRPMSNYPALYNGSDVFNNISGIPIDIVDRVEILPGGASSLYGSDALAGVVNFILKEKYEGTTLRVRGGAYSGGGGSSNRISLTNGFNAFDNRLNVITSVQYETSNPIWNSQRNLTDSFNTDGYSPIVASRDYLVNGFRNMQASLDATGGRTPLADPGYLLPNGIDCSKVTSQFGGTEDLRYREGSGYYCGSFMTPGYGTLKNGKDSGQFYSHATFDVNDNFQLYGDLLYSHERVKYSGGSSYTWWGTSLKYGYYYDPDYDALVNLQRAFSPEDIGGLGYRDIMNTNTQKSYTFTIGGKGSFGEAWDYDISFTRNESKLDERNWVRYADKIDDYFSSHILGPQDGWDPYFGNYPIFHPNYDAFFSTDLTPADFASFTGFATNRSKTWDDLFRAQLTNTDLFSLPGGSAGLALAVEAGNEGWDYTPDPNMLQDPETFESNVWGQSSVSGAGHRTKYAAMGELRLPFFEMLTASLSARYDAFDAYGDKVDKTTWSAGLEFRPFESLLIRGKYGTAFKAPTLADLYQGVSGYYGFDNDYYRCGLAGYTPGNTEGCQFEDFQHVGAQSGNRELQPITADVWSLGLVWSPLTNLNFKVDYLNWKLKNETNQLEADQILLQEYYCRNGLPGPGIVSCDNVADWVTRNGDTLVSVYTPKINIARQNLEVITGTVEYLLDVGRWGALQFSGNYTQTRKHTLQTDPTQGFTDVLNNPTSNWVYGTGPKYKLDAAVSWNIDKWTTTLYANQIGSTPNYVAYNEGNYSGVNDDGYAAGRWGSYTTYNLGVDYRALDNLTLSLQVNNVANKVPDFQVHSFPGTEGQPYRSDIYSAFGRSMYLELRYDFGKSVN